MTQRRRGPGQWLPPPPSQRGKTQQQPGQKATSTASVQNVGKEGRRGGKGLPTLTNNQTSKLQGNSFEHA